MTVFEAIFYLFGFSLLLTALLSFLFLLAEIAIKQRAVYIFLYASLFVATMSVSFRISGNDFNLEGFENFITMIGNHFMEIPKKVIYG